ncbi:YczE/YyaS/YitT family protein [Pediococcus siamensis]|uniref:YczE/YyaS/YitT family protein n=1 Tax=Pediococcus siamensis TaxID=381829 RepID=UPI0039A2A397
MDKNRDFKKRLLFLALSIVLNASSNALTVASHCGSAIWTASSVNLSEWFHFSLGAVLFVEGIAVVLANALLLKQFDWHRMLGNLVFMIPFSYLVGSISTGLDQHGFLNLPLSVRVVADILGIVGIGIAVSIYQRANIVLHPNDDLTYIVRFKFMHGKAATAQWISYIPAISLILLTFIVSRHIYAIGIGTILAFILQGIVTGWADQHVFPALKHHLNI